jgi:hypothetical protein
MPTKTLTSPFARPRSTEQSARDALAALLVVSISDAAWTTLNEPRRALLPQVR